MPYRPIFDASEIVDNYLAARENYRQQKLQEQELARKEEQRQFENKRNIEKDKLEEDWRKKTFGIQTKKLGLELQQQFLDNIFEGKLRPSTSPNAFKAAGLQSQLGLSEPDRLIDLVQQIPGAEQFKEYGVDIPGVSLERLPEFTKPEWQIQQEQIKQGGAAELLGRRLEATAALQKEKDAAAMERARLNATEAWKRTQEQGRTRLAASNIAAQSRIEAQKTKLENDPERLTPEVKTEALNMILRNDPAFYSTRYTDKMRAQITPKDLAEYKITLKTPDGKDIPGVTGKTGLGTLTAQQSDDIKNMQPIKDYILLMKDLRDAVNENNWGEVVTIRQQLRGRLPVLREQLKGLGVLSNTDIDLLEKNNPGVLGIKFDNFSKGFTRKYQSAIRNYAGRIGSLLAHLPEGHRNALIYQYRLAVGE